MIRNELKIAVKKIVQLRLKRFFITGPFSHMILEDYVLHGIRGFFTINVLAFSFFLAYIAFS